MSEVTRIKVGIVFGGVHEEHPVSVKSAQEVARSIDTEKYEAYWIGITKAGDWRLCDGPEPSWEDGAHRPVVLSPERSTHGLLVLGEGSFETIRLDVVLPVLHGKLGEDGAIQGLFELSGIPYVGCDVQSSALCMDKSLAYTVVGAAGIATPTYWTLGPGDAVEALTEPGVLDYPVFVKPARSGSSFGVSKVNSAEELADAVATAGQYDDKVLVEAAVVAEEIGCAVLGNGADLVTGEVDHVSLSHGFFKIHQEDTPETGSENATFIVPADIPVEAQELVKERAQQVYRALGCRGLARVDLFLTPEGDVVLNEVNTLPGLTSYSRYPRMMAAAGVSMTELIDRTIALALADSR